MIPVKPVLWTAAIFNMAVAAIFVAAPETVLERMTGAAAPGMTGVMYLFASAVFAFGLGYAWAAIDLARNRAIIRLAVIGKLGAFVAGLSATLWGGASVQALIGGSFDLVFAGLFVLVLRQTAASAV